MGSPEPPSDGASSTSEPSRTPPPDEWAQDIASLYILEEFIVPLPTELPSERKVRERLYSGLEGAHLTRENLILAMLEIDAGWALG
jgi:hypothetical protein